MRSIRWLSMIALLAVGACSGDQEPAQEALKAGQAAIEAAREEAARYVPDELKRLDADLKTAQEHFDNKRYAEALAAAKDLATRGQDMAKMAAGRKEELTRNFEDINMAVPGLLEQIQSRMESLGDSVPEGVEPARFAEYKALLPNLGKQLQDAVHAAQSGDIPRAVDLGSEAQAKATEIAQVIGATPAQ